MEAPADADLQQENQALREEVAALRAALASPQAGEREQARREAAASEPVQRELYYRTLFHNANDAVLVYHLAADGTPSRYVEVNQVACERLGYTREELLRMTPADMVDPAAVSVASSIQELREAGTLITESVHVTKEGRRVPTEVSAHLFEMDGRPTVLSVCRDITERKRAEEQVRQAKEALERSLARREAIMELALDCIVTMDHHGRIVEFNPAAERIFNYNRGEVIGKPVADVLIPPRLRDAHRRGMKRFLETGRSNIFGRRMVMPAMRADGSEFPAEVAITCAHLEGEPFFTGYVRDVSARRRVERERAELLERERKARAEAEASEAQVAFLAEASVVLASSLDYEETLQTVADLAVPRLADWCAISMLDWEAEDGARLQQVASAHIDPAKEAVLYELMRRYPLDPEAPHGSPEVVRTGQPSFLPEVTDAMLVQGARDAGHLKLLRQLGVRSMIIVPMKVRDETLGTILLIRAESEQRYTEADLRLAEELARRAALEINNARLYRAAEEARWHAEEMSRLKSAFLANMSHEIRTPLTGIIGFAALLAERIPEREREYALRIKAGGQRLLDTLNAVLALSQLEANQAKLQPEVVQVAEEASQALRLLEEQAQKKGLMLTFEVASDAESVRACLDRGALSSILQNLVSNAIKFTDQGSITVVLKKAPDGVYLHVVDTGLGIDDSFLPHLFEPFQQASKGWSRSHEGAGLGLPITKQLVERMNGRIEVESKKGQGSRFSVWFPLIDAEEAVVVTGADAGIEEEAPRTHARLLIVEDNEDTQLLMQTILSEVGDVKVAASAEDALAKVHGAWAAGKTKERLFDLVLIDINLGPGKSGVDLLQDLRALPAYRRVPFVAVTGYALPGDRERMLEMNFDAYVAKPFDPRTFLQQITQLLRPSMEARG